MGAIQFLKEQSDHLENKLIPEEKAEIHILIAENLAKLGQWKKSSELLEKALRHIQQHSLVVLGSYLLGQVLQKEGSFEKASMVFSRLYNRRPAQPLLFWSGVKKAESARLSGNPNQAISVCREMISNGKYKRWISELFYQQALNFIAVRNYKRTVSYFKKALESRNAVTPRKLIAKTYYQLGLIYSKYMSDYATAVAYFDSASTQNIKEKTVQRIGDKQLTSAYKKYAMLKKTIQREDSLLELGRLSDRELKTKLSLMRKQNKKKSLRGDDSNQNQSFLNNPREDSSLTNHPGNISSQYGFLNYKNPELVKKERANFIATWGNRLLADNWRTEVLSGASDDRDSGQQPDYTLSSDQFTNTGRKKNGDLFFKNIPRTDEARQKLHNKLLTDKYRLGNLFFLTLNKPDSAAAYYYQILKTGPEPELESQTYYSLYQLYKVNGRPDSAIVYRHKVLNRFPKSRFAGNILRQRNTNADHSTTGLLAKARRMMLDDSAGINLSHALKLQKLAAKNRASNGASAVYLESIRKYILFVKRKDKDFLQSDTLQFNERDQASYQGEGWDNVRMMLTRFLKLFSDTPGRNQANSWLAVLNQPLGKGIPTCKELGVKPVIIGGREDFIKSVIFPERVRKMNISGMVRFRLTITKSGKVIAIRLLSRPTHLGIEPAYVKAIRKSLHFRPFKIADKWKKVTCDVSFPIKSGNG